LERIADAVQPATRPRDTSRLDPAERLPLTARLVMAVGGSPSRQARARQTRRAFPIRAYVGPNGGGKSLAMVHDVLPSLARGRRVLSTVRILDPDTGRPHPLWVPFTDFAQLLDAEHCDVLMDEIVGIASSREAMRLPAPVQNVLVQLRRRDMTLGWSAPSWARSDKIIREVTQLVTECRGYYPAPVRVGDDGQVRLWAPRRVFRWRSFDTFDFDEWTAGKRDKLDPVAKQWFRGPGSMAFRSYDTLDAVSMVRGGNPDGVCSYCDKKKRVEYCTGHTAEEIAELAAAAEDEFDAAAPMSAAPARTGVRFLPSELVGAPA
jgi:hypothetical protein